MTETKISEITERAIKYLPKFIKQRSEEEIQVFFRVFLSKIDRAAYEAGYNDGHDAAMFEVLQEEIEEEMMLNNINDDDDDLSFIENELLPPRRLRNVDNN